MELTTEKECSALGGLFQQIVNDLKASTPVWEDFIGKATKLHSHIKNTILASTSFFDAFQKIADMATNTRGATKEIGKALTRLCLRHRSVENKLRVFANNIQDHLILPLQDRLEEWRKISCQLDKDHAKEFKRVKHEIKKKSSDTLRLQKKAKKGARGPTQHTLDSALQDVNDKYLLLEESEKQAVRKILIEERSRFCYFVSFITPVVESELAVLQELGHLQEILDSLGTQTQEPFSLPPASEQVLLDLKSGGGDFPIWNFQTPPSSPPSLGSRKSSMCSISSLNSSSSGSTSSPSHRQAQIPAIGVLRVPSISSQDSGFTSQDHLCTRLSTPPPQGSTGNGNAQAAAAATVAPPDFSSPPNATWPNLQDTLQFERAAASILKSQRPHTISTAYEKASHSRPGLTSQTFQPLHNPSSDDTLTSGFSTSSEMDGSPIYNFQPPLPPHRTSSSSLPQVPEKPPSLSIRKGDQIPASSSNNGITGCNNSNPPIYANIAVSNFAGSDSIYNDKATFQKDLAVILAQNLQYNPDKCCVVVESQFPTQQRPMSFAGASSNPRSTATLGRKPPPPVRRSSSLSTPQSPLTTMKDDLLQTLDRHLYGTEGKSNNSSSQVTGYPGTTSSGSFYWSNNNGLQQHSSTPLAPQEARAHTITAHEREAFLCSLKLAQQCGPRYGTLGARKPLVHPPPLLAKRTSASRVKSWLASRPPPPRDINSLKETLMDQIRHGVPLRKVHTNDRSAPRL